MARVWERSKAKGNARLVLLAIADYAHDDGTNAFPLVSTLAKKTLLSERTVSRLVAQLKVIGELDVQERPGRSNLMTVALSSGGDNLALPTEESAPGSATSGVQVVTPLSSTHVSSDTTITTPLSPITITYPSPNHQRTVSSEDDAAAPRRVGTTFEEDGDRPYRDPDREAAFQALRARRAGARSAA